MKWAALFVLGGTACGRLAFDPASATTDAAPDAPPCVLGPFSPPVLVENVNSIFPGADDWAPSITADDLTLYFYSYRSSAPGAPDLWKATRATPADPFAAPQEILELSTASADWSPHVTADELTILFTSDRPGTVGGLDLFQATRASKTQPFSTAVHVVGDAVLPVNSSAGEESVWLSPDGLRVVLETGRDATPDLISAERPDIASPFGPVQLLANVNAGAASDNTPALSNDELELFFSSNRAGGTGGFDIWRAVRPARDQPFGAPENVAELNSAGDEFGASLSNDGQRFYFAYNTAVAGTGDANIYVATRSCQ